jgi:hypothetical protein
MQSGLYNNTEGLKPCVDNFNKDTADQFASGSKKSSYSGQKKIYLIDLWLPKAGVVITMPWDLNEGIARFKLLRNVEWNGPERGPYKLLSFNDVPDNVMPVAPASLWYDLHELNNDLFVKLGRQANRQKTLTLVQKGQGKEDGSKMVDASDGEAITVDSPKNVNEITMGGVNQQNFSFFMTVKELFNYMGGNIDTIGGLGASADTYGQDRLISQAATERLSKMQERTIKFTQEVGRDLAWYLWDDPLINIPITKNIPGTSMSIETSFNENTKAGSFFDYTFDIVPYSMTIESPGQKLSKIGQLLQQYIFPIMPNLQQQGLVLNGEKLLDLVARYSNVHELKNMFTDMQGSEMVIPKSGIVNDQTFPHFKPTERNYNIRRVNDKTNRASANELALSTMQNAGKEMQND